MENQFYIDSMPKIAYSKKDSLIVLSGFILYRKAKRDEKCHIGWFTLVNKLILPQKYAFQYNFL